MKVSFVVGHKYRVLKPGTSIQYDITVGRSGSGVGTMTARNSGSHNLIVGDVIEYVGYLKGSDGFPGEWFRKGDIQGDLFPNNYGMIQDHDLLEEVQDIPQKRKGPLYPHVPRKGNLMSPNWKKGRDLAI